MSREENIRDTVAGAYTKAVTSPTSGCCGGGAGQKGALAQLAGYDASALAELPEDAVANSFGCGDPTAFAEVQEGDVVLDLGSGAGIDLLIAAKKVGPRGSVIGVDMTDAMIERARANVAAAGLTNVEVRKGLIEELPVADNSVDWVISNCVINLSPEKERVFAEIARVLKPGGRMSVSDVVVEDLPARIRDLGAAYTSCVAGAISEPEYIAGLEGAGLAEVEVRARLVYDATQLRGLVAGEIADVAAASPGCGCGASVDDAGGNECGSTSEASDAVANLQRDLPQITADIAGKIWSAKFRARLPTR